MRFLLLGIMLIRDREIAPDEDLFSSTSGRFLYNEDARLDERYVKFDIPALENAIGKHVRHGKWTSGASSNLAKVASIVFF